MIRGKYLRERKAIRVKRRMKLLLALLILCLLHRILFSSYSLYETEANSTADIDVAFYTLEDEYTTNVISLEDMAPGETRICEFSIANYYEEEVEEENEDGSITTKINQVTSETNMEYTLKIRTTTNLPLEYELYKNQSLTVDHLSNILDIEKQHLDLDDDKTIFQNLVLANQTDELKAQGVTDSGEFDFNKSEKNVYTLKITFPGEYNTIDYQNIIDCIEISVDSKQIISEN